MNPICKILRMFSLVSIQFVIAFSAASLAGDEEETAPQGDHREGVTLEDCVRRSFRHNITLLGRRQELASTRTGIESAWGRFDPEFFATVTGREMVSPSTSAYDQIIGVDEYDRDVVSASTGFRGTLLSGATYTLSFNMNRTFDPASGDFLAYNPLHSNNVGIELKQPLLRGAWTTYARADVTGASLATEAQALDVEQGILDVIYQTIEAYWNFVFAIEDLETKKVSLTLAEDLLAINQRKKDEGIFSKMEVLEASADVAVKREQLLTARNAVKSAEDQLKRQIFPFETEADWEMGLVPLTPTREASDVAYSEDALLVEAIDHRADFRRLEVQYENRELDLIRARNEILPAFDLVGSWQYAGIGSNYGNAWDDVVDRDYKTFSVGVEFAYPIGNRTAKGALRKAEIDLQRALTALKELRIQMAHEIRDAVREVRLQRERILATRESWRLSKERYEGEKKRLEAGITIPYQVREAERNLSEETVNKTRALVDYQIALAKISQVKGTLLDEYGILVDLQTAGFGETADPGQDHVSR